MQVSNGLISGAVTNGGIFMSKLCLSNCQLISLHPEPSRDDA